MSLVIYSNPLAVNNQNDLTRIGNNLNSSIEKLSSGIRINKSSDDASGMAVSTKLMTQIRGFSVASRNVQDGISYTQTTEGVISAVESATQRIRELAVQAATSTYTSDDRLHIQDEVDQLKDEIDRITASAEFNTKKLLNGDSSGLWSSDSDQLASYIVGRTLDGDYKIKMTAEAGKNYVYKSHIMRLANGEFGGDINITSNNQSNMVMMGTDKELLGGLARKTRTSYYTFEISSFSNYGGGNGITTSATLEGVGLQPDSAFRLGNISSISSFATFDPLKVGLESQLSTGYLEFRVQKVDMSLQGAVTATYNEINTVFSSLATTTEIEYRFYNAKNGEQSGWIDASVTNINPNENYIAAVHTGLGINTRVVLSGLLTSMEIKAGDTFAIAQQGVASASFTISGGGGLVQVRDGVTSHSISGSLWVGYTRNELTKLDNDDLIYDTNRNRIFGGYFNNHTNRLEFGGFELYFEESTANASGIVADTLTGIVTGYVNDSASIATRTTRMKDLNNFINTDGRRAFNLDQEVSLYAGNGKYASTVIEGEDTLIDVNTKFLKMLDEMGHTATLNNVNIISSERTIFNINNNLSNFVSKGQAQSGTPEDVEGTITLQSALIGSESSLDLIATQDLINGFGFTADQEGKNSSMNVAVLNASDKKQLGEVFVHNNKVTGVIDGVNVQFASNAGLELAWSDSSRKIGYTDNIQSDYFLHIKKHASDLHVGPNEGQTVEISIREMSVNSLGLTRAYVFGQEEASHTISLTDSALDIIADVRGKLGAYENRLSFTMGNIDVARFNLTNSYSRISDTDIAKQTTELTKYQVMKDVNTSMLAQANKLPSMALTLLQ